MQFLAGPDIIIMHFIICHKQLNVYRILQYTHLQNQQKHLKDKHFVQWQQIKLYIQFFCETGVHSGGFNSILSILLTAYPNK